MIFGNPPKSYVVEKNSRLRLQTIKLLKNVLRSSKNGPKIVFNCRTLLHLVQAPRLLHCPDLKKFQNNTYGVELVNIMFIMSPYTFYPTHALGKKITGSGNPAQSFLGFCRHCPALATLLLIYYIQRRFCREYSTGQLDKCHENYLFQRQRLRYSWPFFIVPNPTLFSSPPPSHPPTPQI